MNILSKKSPLFYGVFVCGLLLLLFLIGQFASCSSLTIVHYHPFWRKDCQVVLPCVGSKEEMPCVGRASWRSEALAEAVRDYPEIKLPERLAAGLETRIRNLATVYNHDTYLQACLVSGKGKYTRIPEQECRKLFSKTGWESYSRYIGEVSSYLSEYKNWSLLASSKAARFYKGPDNIILFTISGDAIARNGDSVAPIGHFNMAVWFRKTDLSDSLENILIEDMMVTLTPDRR